jgi:hypothetical protein
VSLNPRDFRQEPNGPTPWWAPLVVFFGMMLVAFLAGMVVGIWPGFR